MDSPRTSGSELGPERFAIQGEAGSFSHEAARAVAAGLGVSARIVPCARSAEVFRALVAGEVDGAVIPIENSLAGSVLEHYDLLRTHPVRVVGERLLRIRHNLIAAPEARLEDVREVYSHHIALEQCRRFFVEHPQLRACSFYDTAGSVRHVIESGQKGMAAIASREAAGVYGGALLAEGIEDDQENYTRFFLLRQGSAQVSSVATPAKVSLCFAVENRAGSLVEALQVFAARAISLTKLESRPVPGSPWQYVFYADFGIGHDLEGAGAALVELGGSCREIKVLGCYPAAPNGIPSEK